MVTYLGETSASGAATAWEPTTVSVVVVEVTDSSEDFVTPLPLVTVLFLTGVLVTWPPEDRRQASASSIGMGPWERTRELVSLVYRSATGRG